MSTVQIIKNKMGGGTKRIRKRNLWKMVFPRYYNKAFFGEAYCALEVGNS